jgi:hypothetical protein
VFTYSKLTETVSAAKETEEQSNEPSLQSYEMFDSAEQRAAKIGILADDKTGLASEVYGCGMSCSGCSAGATGCGCSCSCSSSCIGSGFTYSSLTNDPISMELSMPGRLVAAVAVLDRED